jgi:hypothetical protein
MIIAALWVTKVRDRTRLTLFSMPKNKKIPHQNTWQGIFKSDLENILFLYT